MTKYLRHNYSGRVYQIMTDHGEEHPYLSSFPYVRTISKATRERFFKGYENHPPESETSISFYKELEWERVQLRESEPIEVKAPGKVHQKKSTKKSTGRGYTLGTICQEMSISPAKARKALRGMKKKPQEGWVWSTLEEVEKIKEILKNL